MADDVIFFFSRRVWHEGAPSQQFRNVFTRKLPPLLNFATTSIVVPYHASSDDETTRKEGAHRDQRRLLEGINEGAHKISVHQGGQF